MVDFSDDGYMYEGCGNDLSHFNLIKTHTTLPGDEKDINLLEKQKLKDYFFQLVDVCCPEESICKFWKGFDYIKFRGVVYNVSDPVEARKLEHEIVTSKMIKPSRTVTADQYIKEITGQNK